MSTQETAPNQNIESTLTESRSFPPPEEFSRNAIISSAADYEKLRARASADPDGFWSDIARELHWFKPWDKVLEWNVPWAKWFLGGKINLSYNCLDRHVANLAQEQGCHYLGERAGRSPHAHLPAVADGSEEVRQRAEVARRQVWRSRRDLHGHVSRAADRDAGVRPHRRRALGHLRRILRQRAG